MNHRPDPPRQPHTPAWQHADPPPTSADQHWQLRLYVAGQMPCSMTALANLLHLCRQHLPGRHHIEVVDVFDDHTRAAADGVVAVPTLICRSPNRSRRIVGNLSDTNRVLTQIQLTRRQPPVG